MSLNENDIRNFLSEHDCVVSVADDDIFFYTNQEIPEKAGVNNLIGLHSEQKENYWEHKTRFNPVNSFVLRYCLFKDFGRKIKIRKEDSQKLSEKADTVKLPTAKMSLTGKNVEIVIPNIKAYKEPLIRLGAYPSKEGYHLSLNKIIDMESFVENWESSFPAIIIDDDITKRNNEPIPGFDGTVDSLKQIPIDTLNIVSANVQSWKSLQKSKTTMAEKLTKFKLATLHDLLFRIPRKYIDKSNPQLIEDLLEGENATIIGKIYSLATFSGKIGGIRITVEDYTKRRIDVTFWRQEWLQKKFKVGDEIILTGAVSKWKGHLSLNGKTLEHFDEGITLPIVPIYSQSEISGITSAFLISAVRELLQRLGDVKLPDYFTNNQRQPYKEVFQELHIPSSIKEHEKAVTSMAYYEFVYLQLLIQEAQKKTDKRPGLVLDGGGKGFQEKLLENLPYQLTGSQKKAVRKLNAKISEDKPSSSLLMADVGAGKTLVAQLECLQAVGSGFQCVIVAPTDILAKQLHHETVKILDILKEKEGIDVTLGLLSGSMKSAEKKEIQEKIKAGDIDIIVGTHSVLSSKVKYHNLGLVVIDEQQKFGAEQRTKLLESRDDGAIPHILFQTATPIPRSLAQIYYSSLEPIVMKDKPFGRLPIETEWVQEDPVEILKDQLSPVWLDIMSEAEKGNQSFVITPMVTDSSKVDAASVEKAFKELSKNVLSHLKVGFVHGQMKNDEQRETMEKFKNKELDVLVASTVVEVGVNIPDATRMVILSAERMGASSLHQIRGRVGRNSKQSKCYLVSLGKTDSSVSRLQSLVDFQDGFEISKVDLKTRGEGTMFSSVQSGKSDMMFASLSKHSDLIEDAKEEALRILDSSFKDVALADAQDKFESSEMLL